MPAALSSPNFGGNPTPAPSPSAASAVLTYGDNANFQELPQVGGYGGAIAFPTAGPATPAPANSKAKGSPTPAPAPTAVEIAVGVTLSIHKPEDGPDLNLAGGKGKKHKREHPARPLCYIELLPTHDATLTEYPRVAIDIPRDIVTEYRDGEFGIALWNSGEKDSVYHLHVANLDTSTTPPPAALHEHEHTPVTGATPTGSNTAPPTAAAAVTPPPGVFTPTPSPTPTRMPNGQLPTNAPSGAPGTHPSASAAPTLPPQRVLFASTQIPLHLVANRPAIFAIYALPEQTDASPTPLPSASGKPGAAGTTKIGGSPAPVGNGNGTPAPTTIQTTPAPQAATTTSAPAAAGTPQPGKSEQP